MTEDREDYMRRQEAEHDMIRMRDKVAKRYTVTGFPPTERMKLLGITGMAQMLGGGWEITTPNGKTYAPQEVAVWLVGSIR